MKLESKLLIKVPVGQGSVLFWVTNGFANRMRYARSTHVSLSVPQWLGH